MKHPHTIHLTVHHPCAWALGTAAVAVGLVIAGAASTAENTAVPQDVALTSAEGDSSATAGPQSGSDPTPAPDRAPAPERDPRAAALGVRLTDAFSHYRPAVGPRGLAVVVDAGERTPPKRRNPRPVGDPATSEVRLGPP